MIVPHTFGPATPCSLPIMQDIRAEFPRCFRHALGPCESAFRALLINKGERGRPWRTRKTWADDASQDKVLWYGNLRCLLFHCTSLFPVYITRQEYSTIIASTWTLLDDINIELDWGEVRHIFLFHINKTNILYGYYSIHLLRILVIIFIITIITVIVFLSFTFITFLCFQVFIRPRLA